MTEHKATPVILGGGLVGSLLAIHCARLGMRDTVVIEKRADPSLGLMGEGRSINLAISARGLKALEEVGLREQALARAIAMPGRMIHQLSGRLDYQAYGKTGEECIHSISRGELNRMLREAESGGVRWQFDENILAVDARTGLITTCHSKTSAQKTWQASQIFGTDGAGSLVRQSIQDCAGDAASISQETLSHGYKELLLPAVNGAFAIEKHALHIWPRGAFMLIALPNLDGSFTCTLFLPLEGPCSFAAIKTPADVQQLFASQFPDALALIPDLTEQYFARPLGKMVTVRSCPWHCGGRSVLLGDAAHAIVPFFGQGMNCGFEDVSLLAKKLKTLPKSASAYDWQAVFAEYQNARKANADAIAAMALNNFIEMRDLVADPRFLLRKACEKKLELAFPETFVSRYSLVSFSLTPYAEAMRLGAVQDAILDELCQDLRDVEALDLGKAEILIKRHAGVAATALR